MTLKTKMTKENWDNIRKPYLPIIQNLTNNIDIASEQFALTKDPGYHAQYERLKEELCKLKDEIKRKEEAYFGLPSSFVNRN